MIPQSSSTSALASLAEASYVDFSLLPRPFAVDGVRAALQDSDRGGEFTASQATQLVADWSLVEHTPNTSSGYSSSLFRSKEQPNRYVLALRGSEPGDAWSDFIATDVGDIALDGLAIRQIVDLYNDWKRLSAPQGAAYLAARMERLDAPTAAYQIERSTGVVGATTLWLRSQRDVVVDDPAGTIYRVRIEDSSKVFGATDARAHGVGAVPASAELFVTGHSLGGHLAAAFSRLFPATGAEALMVNGAGFASEAGLGSYSQAAANVRNLFAALGGAPSFDFTRIDDIYGSAGWQLISQNSPFGLVQPGGHHEVATESFSLVNSLGHGASQMTDASTVVDLLFRLDPAIASKQIGQALAAVRPIVDGSANDRLSTFESVVSMLGRLADPGFDFDLGTNATRTDDLYRAIGHVGEAIGGRTASLVDLTGRSASELASVAGANGPDAVAWRYALSELNPVAFGGWDHASHAHDGRLALSDADGGGGRLSADWIADRAAFLALRNRVNLSDSSRVWMRGEPATQYVDREHGVSIQVAPPIVLGAPRLVIFGTDASEAFTDALEGGPAGDRIHGMDGADEIRGGDGADRLYGGRGSDTIQGGAHDDLIDGGAGADVLLSGDAGHDRILGGTGEDVLDGGAGDDVLDGGPDADMLKGGLGHDTYTIRNGSGLDAVDDADGLGRIVLVDAAGIRRVVGGVALADRSKPNTWTLFDSSGNHIAVTRNSPLTLSAPDGTRVIVENYGDRGLGFGLGGSFVDATPQRTLTGDAGSDKRDTLTGTSMDELFTPGLDDDGVYAGDGMDRVRGGVGRDVIHGEGGADLLEGDEGADILFGGSGDDRLYAGAATSTDPFQAVAGALATAQAGGGTGRSDWLGGGEGNDVLLGGGDADVLTGGAGADVLVGGNGYDTLLGDVETGPATRDWGYYDTFVGNTWTRTFTGMDFGAEESPDPGVDSLYGGGGNDLVLGGGGDDILHGDAGDDRLGGDAGNDVLFGGDGIDTIAGDGTLRTAHSANGADYIDGGAGNDILAGQGAGDTIYGGSGNDQIHGDEPESSIPIEFHGADTIDGGEGNDSIEADGGDDSVEGGQGNDAIWGGAGNDTLLGGGEDDTLQGETGVDALDGGVGRDTLYGGDDGDRIAGGADDDLASGGTGDDIVDGGTGNDHLEGNDGSDAVDGGLGNDTLYGNAGDDGLAGGAGVDTLQGGDGNDELGGGDGDDRLWGEASDDVLDGGEGADLLSGGAGRDTLFAGAGNDAAWGGEGDDTLIAAGGFDQLAGGDGSDAYVIDVAANTVVVDDRSGANVVRLGAGFDVATFVARQAVDASGNDRHLVIESGAAAQRLVIAHGMDGAIGRFEFADGQVFDVSALLARIAPGEAPQAIDLSSSLANQGTPGDDTLEASFGGHRQDGYGGNDVLTGGPGADRLDGGDGADRLDGAAGDDTLVGGPGADTYVFGRVHGRDVVEDRFVNRAGASELDTLELAAGVTADDVTLHRDGSDLVLAIDETAAQLRVRNHFVETELVRNAVTGVAETWSADHRIEAIRFDDGTLWDAATIASRTVSGTPDEMAGTMANDTFVVDHADDTVVESAGGGDDTIRASVSYALRPNVERLVLTGNVDLAAWSNPGTATSHLTGNAGNNVFNGPGTYLDGSGKAVVGSSGATMGYAVMAGGPGDDTYHLRQPVGGQVIEAASEGRDTVVLDGGDWMSYTLPANVEALRSAEGGVSTPAGTRFRTGNELDNYLEASPVANALTGPANVVDGGPGADTMVGFGASDAFVVDHPGDRVLERGVFENGSQQSLADEVRASVSYELPDNVEILRLTGPSAIDGRGNDLPNTLDGSENLAANRLAGGRSDDTFRVGANDLVAENPGEGIDTVEWSGTGTRTYTAADLPAHVEALAMADDLGASGFAGDMRDDRVTGNGSPNALLGGGGDDVLRGGAGEDQLEGGEGNDLLDGGTGYDTLRFSRGFGQDTITGTGGYEIAFDATVGPGDVLFERGELRLTTGEDRIRLVTVGDIRFADGTWWSANDVTTRLNASYSTSPTDGHDTLVGTELADVLDARAGNDFLHGLAGDDSLTGGSGNDELHGDDGVDTLDGGAGADKLWGGAGADVIAAGDDADNAWGEAGNDRIAGGGGNDQIRGGAEDDALEGGTGDDFLLGDEGSDTLDGGSGSDYLAGGEGGDRLHGDVAGAVGPADNADILIGGAGDDRLEGGGGADSLYGEEEVDTYVLQRGGAIDTVFENPVADELSIVEVDATLGPSDVSLARRVDEYGRKWFRIAASGDTDGLDFEYQDSLPAVEVRFADGTTWSASEVAERLSRQDGTDLDDSLEGTDGDDRLYGHGGNDTLIGLAGNDLIDGGAGADAMEGGEGDDHYVVDGAADVVLEHSGFGIDTVESVVSYVLPENVDHLLLAGAATNGTGNALANSIRGNALGNVLDGKGGADQLVGGDGNDTYVVDNAGDLVVENAAEGADLVQSSVTHTLAANVENLALAGAAAINGTGNGLANTITGNAAANLLNGGAGNDSLRGGAGNDTYVVDSTGDVVVENASAGTDLVQSSVTHTLAANVENLTLTGTAAINGTGNGLANTITGNAVANLLNGGAGNDSLRGGGGNDTYVVDSTGDVVVESASAGTDLVQSSVTHTLAANVESLTLTGTAAINGTGNTLANVLVGNASANILDGGSGADSLQGGAGNDTLVVDNAGDKVVELAAQGDDTVKSYIAWTLGANVENLALVGTAAINGTGNTLDNWLLGNAASNSLSGADGQDLLFGDLGGDTIAGGNGRDILQGGDGADVLSESAGSNLLHGGSGDDVLAGGAGNDLLVGGAGNDTITTGAGADIIAFGRGDGQDVVNASTGADNTLSLGKGIRYADVALRKSGSDLVVEAGSTEQLTLKDWYASSLNRHVVNLQMIVDATADWNASSSNPLYSRRVATFDFAGLVSRFDAALAADPALARWGVADALPAFHAGGSDAAALGGDLGYQYGRNGTLAGIGWTPADAVLASASFGAAMQTFQSSASLFSGTKTLR
jgi:Ca2+-binding RTX toxin-like protein